MAGKLVQVATNTVTSGVLSVSLTGIDSDDVYLVTVTDLVSFNDAQDLFYRVTASGVADTTANYDKASKILRTDTTFTNTTFQNGTSVSDIRGGTGTGEKHNYFITYIILIMQVNFLLSFKKVLLLIVVVN